jgi:hypothetical protein
VLTSFTGQDETPLKKQKCSKINQKENCEEYSEWEFSFSVVGMDCNLSVSYVV